MLEPSPVGTIVEGPFRSLRTQVPIIDPNGRMYNISKYPGDVRSLVTTNDRKLKTAKVKYVIPILREEEAKVAPRNGGYGGRSLLSSPVSVSLKIILAPGSVLFLHFFPIFLPFYASSVFLSFLPLLAFLVHF